MPLVTQYRHHQPQSIRRVTLSPFRQLHIRLLEGENPSNSVSRLCLVAGQSTNTSLAAAAAPLVQPTKKKSQLNRPPSVSLGSRFNLSLSPQPGKTVFRGSLSHFPSHHQPICKRKNECLLGYIRHVCARIITHTRTLPLHRSIKRCFDDEEQNINHRAIQLLVLPSLHSAPSHTFVC